MARSSGAWIFQIEPKEWDVNKWLRDVARSSADPELRWPVTDHPDRIKPGQRVYLWRAGDHRTAGILGLARVVGDISDHEEDKPEYRKAAFEAKYAPTQPRVPIRVEAVLSKPLYRVKLEWTDETKGLSVIGDAEGSEFAVRPAEEAALERLCEPLTAPRA